MKATGIVRRIDDLGRVVIPKEIRRTMRIREGDPSQITLARWERFCFAMLDLSKRWGLDCTWWRGMGARGWGFGRGGMGGKG